MTIQVILLMSSLHEPHSCKGSSFNPSSTSTKADSSVRHTRMDHWVKHHYSCSEQISDAEAKLRVCEREAAALLYVWTVEILTQSLH